MYRSGFKSPTPQTIGYGLRELTDQEWFRQIRVGAHFQGLPGHIGLLESADHDDNQVRPKVPELARTFESRHPRHANIHQHNLRLPTRDFPQCLLGAGVRVDGVKLSGLYEDLASADPVPLFIIYMRNRLQAT